jgi:nitroimidazol reductase NimA-like FMN-containing flavoprotein (pyridoxamine 5'-phosphate oxidase superfamily)
MTSETTSDPVVPTPELLREIEPSRCLQLLEAVRYGRLATVDAGEPLLVVVNHIVDAGDIYMRTRPEGPAGATDRGQPGRPRGVRGGQRLSGR